MKIIALVFSIALAGLAQTLPVQAQEPEDVISSYHQILDAIRASEAPAEVKQNLLRDVLTTMQQTIENADIPESRKARLREDLRHYETL